MRLKNYNDPIYGFISIPTPFISTIIQEPVFQRLRRIQQMGLSHYVFNGATHHRFAHALGAMHLMHKTLEILTSKGTPISESEREAAMIAILLHDLGHGPFSHALEGVLVENVPHEFWSLSMMKILNDKYDGKLSLAIQMFEGKYKRSFFNQLISSQLDMDRLDYLKRDSFYSGVTEGNISTDRIIAMLRVYQDKLVVEEKGMYSIEKFLLARRLMYWSVYLHKTSYVAEEVLKRIILRARELLQNGDTIQASTDLLYFLSTSRSSLLEVEMKHFAAIDDVDVWAMIKAGVDHHDPVYSALCEKVLNRRLPKIEVSNVPFSTDFIEKQKDIAVAKLGISTQEVTYFVFDGKMKNMAYNFEQSPIILIQKNGVTKELLAGSDESNLKMLTKAVTKYYCCYPK
ncbi:MAG: phosphohydrolase [Flavobacteriaceae bacterium]|nr:phosphohydrolase [Flavobacteriaceae bacterium]